MKLELNSKPDYQSPKASNSQREIVLTKEKAKDTIKKEKQK